MITINNKKSLLALALVLGIFTTMAIVNIINNVAVAQTEGNSDPFATPPSTIFNTPPNTEFNTPPDTIFNNNPPLSQSNIFTFNGTMGAINHCSSVNITDC